MCPFRYIGLIEASTLEITFKDGHRGNAMPASALHSVDDNLLFSFYLWRFLHTLNHKYDFRFVSRKSIL